MVGRGGRVVLVVIHRVSLELKAKKLLFEEAQLRASMNHTKSDLIKAIELVAYGRIDLSKSVKHRLKLQETSRGSDILEKKVGSPGRAVLIP
jgi:threonine dehydrogenase-like Zn-dependent dehydrogenase